MCMQDVCKSVCPCARVCEQYFDVCTQMHTAALFPNQESPSDSHPWDCQHETPAQTCSATRVPPRMPLPLCPPAACPRWGQQDSPMLPIAFPGSCFPVAPVSRGAQLSPSVISREEGQPGKCPSPSPSVLRFPKGAPCAGRRCRQAARTEGKPAAPPPVFSIF